MSKRIRFKAKQYRPVSTRKLIIAFLVMLGIMGALIVFVSPEPLPSYYDPGDHIVFVQSGATVQTAFLSVDAYTTGVEKTPTYTIVIGTEDLGALGFTVHGDILGEHPANSEEAPATFTDDSQHYLNGKIIVTTTSISVDAKALDSGDVIQYTFTITGETLGFQDILETAMPTFAPEA